ncbi:MAG: hypothetical protein QM627_11240 [Luteolibacter sp.]
MNTNPVSPPKEQSLQVPQKEPSLLLFCSVPYLVMGYFGFVAYLGLVGVIDFFGRWENSFHFLFWIAAPFFLAAALFLTWLHPLICLIVVIRSGLRGELDKSLMMVGGLSLVLAAAFFYFISRGYIITV